MAIRKGLILVLYEGTDAEPRVLATIKKVFSQLKNKDNVFYIDLEVAYGDNIYSLYSRLKKDEDESIYGVLHEMCPQVLTGIKEDDISEIYLFFDLDVHHKITHDGRKIIDLPDNLQKVEDMLKFFGDEADNGKLYISYPMLEALKDIKMKNCCESRCFANIYLGRKYKQDVGDNQHDFSDIDNFGADAWNFFCSHAICKANCILNNQYALCTYDVGKDFTQDKIFDKQRQLVESKNMVYVLSGFPFFLLEYFGKNKWSEWQVPSGYKLEKAKVCPLKNEH